MEVNQPKEAWNQPTSQENKKIVAGIFALLLGGIGVHKFYLGYFTEGIIQIILSLTCIGGVIPLIEGILYLIKTDEEFFQTYQVNKRGWF